MFISVTQNYYKYLFCQMRNVYSEFISVCYAHSCQNGKIISNCLFIIGIFLYVQKMVKRDVIGRDIQNFYKVGFHH